ncbi:hypothetical protein, partial [uncultured Halomonas sp.]|uniref:hypothetical protein n=1 Tax=uncultured Halomonas sp. TaxID=173971 RepID=UPI0026089899
IDETSRGYKNPKRRTTPKKGTRGKRNLTRFGAAVNVRGLPQVRRIVELTGTPAPNGPLDLWAQIYLLDQGERLGKTFEMYKRRYFNENPYSYEITPLPGAEEEIYRRIDDLVISMSEEDYLSLPERIYQEVPVTLPPKVKEQYDYFRRHFVMEHHDDIEAVNSGALVNKCLQLCIAEGTPVLTRRGWVAIQDVRAGDDVWDGVEWVRTSGALAKGERETVSCFGVHMTPDHEVLTQAGWATAEEVLHGDASSRFSRAEVRLPDGVTPPRAVAERARNVGLPLHLWEGGRSDRGESAQQESRGEEVVRLSPWRDAAGCVGRSRHDGLSPVGHLEQHAAEVQQPQGQGLQELRCAGDQGLPPMGGIFRRLLGGHETGVRGPLDPGSAGQQQGVQSGELPLGDAEGAAPQHEGECARQYPVGEDHGGGSGGAQRHQADHDIRADKTRVAGESATGARERVYDLLDCGPRHRFVVSGERGPLVVHNCNGSIYNDQGEDQWFHDEKLHALQRIIEDAQADEEQVLVAYWFQFDLARLKKAFPKAVVLGEDPDAIQKWKRRQAGVMFIHPASGGHGLNLQAGGRLMVWYGLTWDLDLYLQLNKRLHRGEQARPVIIKHIIAEGTDDERVLPRLTEKNASQTRLLKAVAV